MYTYMIIYAYVHWESERQMSLFMLHVSVLPEGMMGHPHRGNRGQQPLHNWNPKRGDWVYTQI